MARLSFYHEHTWSTWIATYFQGAVIKSSGWLLLKITRTYENNPYERACTIVRETSTMLLKGILRLMSPVLFCLIYESSFFFTKLSKTRKLGFTTASHKCGTVVLRWNYQKKNVRGKMSSESINLLSRPSEKPWFSQIELLGRGHLWLGSDQPLSWWWCSNTLKMLEK